MSTSTSTGFDSGERKLAELALRESEERFRKIVEQAPIPMAIVGMDGVIEFINRKAVEASTAGKFAGLVLSPGRNGMNGSNA